MVYGGLPVIFVRYNPDNFLSNGNVQQTPEKKRLKRLSEVLEDCMECRPDEFLRIEYLFYDDDKQQRLEELTKFLITKYL